MSNDAAVHSPDVVTPGSAHQPTPALVWGLATRRATRRFLDHLARLMVQTGGILVILSILAIFAFLVLEVAPLFHAPTAHLTGRYALAKPLPGSQENSLIGADEHEEIHYVVGAHGITFIDPLTGGETAGTFPEPIHNRKLTVVARAAGKGNQFGLATVDGQVIPASIEYSSSLESGRRANMPSISAEAPLQADPNRQKIVRLAYQRPESGSVAAVFTEAGRLWLSSVLTTVRPSGESTATVTSVELTEQVPGTITALALDSRGENLAVGTADGYLYHFDVREITRPVLIASVLAAPGGISTLGYLLGDRSLAVGGKSGEVSVWMPVPLGDTSTTRLEAVHRFASHPASVTSISPSQRDRGFLTGDAKGNVFLHYSTTDHTLIRIPGEDSPIRSIFFSPKANGASALDDAGHLRTYAIDNPHPEITFAALFRPVWYEGYSEPAHVWQSSGASDDFEAKFGFTPLIVGTLKGTFYALLLAVPLAVLAAMYTSMFMHPDLRARIKPVIEIMAALPTVVLGFLAGLWMAPLLERIFPAVIGMFLTVPVGIVLASLAWQVVPQTVRNRYRPGAELLVLVPVIAGAVILCLSLNASLESWPFGGNYKQWLSSTFGVRYDQRNALVVGFAMGFAIIPIIFSISEESLSNVPKSLIAGSLALGATRWQTLARLVFVSASPGIFSALMIGFGRAVGETMIVLMATGNTPVLNWSAFDGFRTLSANIAVEIPEAPHGGTLYRTLFLAALLLFAITFLVNTAAEVIRQRLRKKYSQF